MGEVGGHAYLKEELEATTAPQEKEGKRFHASRGKRKKGRGRGDGSVDKTGRGPRNSRGSGLFWTSAFLFFACKKGLRRHVRWGGVGSQKKTT